MRQCRVLFSTSWQGHFKVLTKVRSLLRGSAKQLRLATGDCQPRPEAEQSITLLPTAPATSASHPKHFVHRRSRLFSCRDTLHSFTLTTSLDALLELRLFALCLYLCDLVHRGQNWLRQRLRFSGPSWRWLLLLCFPERQQGLFNTNSLLAS